LVVKPAGAYRRLLLRVAELFSRSGIAAGALNVVCGKGSVVGEALVQHPASTRSRHGVPKVGRGILQAPPALQEGDSNSAENQPT